VLRHDLPCNAVIPGEIGSSASSLLVNSLYACRLNTFRHKNLLDKFTVTLQIWFVVR